MHARSVALFGALKENPNVLLANDQHREMVINLLLEYAASDKVTTAFYVYNKEVRMQTVIGDCYPPARYT